MLLPHCSDGEKKEWLYSKALHRVVFQLQLRPSVSVVENWFAVVPIIGRFHYYGFSAHISNFLICKNNSVFSNLKF